MDTKAPWWHRFMSKECFIIAFAGFIFGAWTMWYHMRPELPLPEPPPPEENEPDACRDTIIPRASNSAASCPSVRQRMMPLGDSVLCSCQPSQRRR